MEPTENLIRKLFLKKEEITDVLSTPGFYVELIMVMLAITLAGLVAILIRRRVKAHLDQHPPRRIDAEFILKPLSLLATILTLIYLSVLKPFAVEYGFEGELVEPALQLSIAYLLSKCVILIVQSRPMGLFIALVIMTIAVLDVTGFTRTTTTYLNGMAIDIGQVHLSMLNLIRGLVILVVVFWIAGISSSTLESYLRRSSRLSYNARELIVKFFRLFVYFTALLITLAAMGVDLTAFAVFGGALGVGVGLGLQKITANFVSGITLLMEKSIRIGDMIEVGGITGRVRELNIRYALVESLDGRDIMVPNDELISTRVINWTHSSNTARIDIKLNVMYGSDPQKVRELMLEAARAHPLALKNPAPNCFLREFGDLGMQFLLIFWIPDVREGRFGPQSEVMIAIMRKFRENEIDVAYNRAASALPAAKVP